MRRRTSERGRPDRARVETRQTVGRAVPLLLACLIVALAGAAGCSSDDGSSADRGSTTASVSSTTATASTDDSSAGPTTEPSTDPSTLPTAPSGPAAGDISNRSEVVSTSTIPKAPVVPFPRNACQALTDDEVAGAPYDTIRNPRVLRSGVDDAGAACGWQIRGDGNVDYTIRVAFVTREQFESDVADASGIQEIDLGDQAYLLPAAPNVIPATNSVWVRVGDVVAQVDGESVASAEQLAASVAARI
jgi:hypothetical protein